MRLFFGITRPVTLTLLTLPIAGVFSACSANENNPDYWTQSHRLGGPPFQQPGAGGVQGAGGIGPGAGGAGGIVSGAGGNVSGAGGIVGGTGGIVGGTGGIVGGTGGIVGGTGGVTGTGGTVSGPPSSCTVTFTVLTGPGTGQFQPKNITAMWIANSQGQLVRTLEVYAATRIVNLTKWEAASSGNVADAVTGATLPNHIQHTGTWDCKDTSHTLVPDGQYQAVMEWTDDDSALFFNPPSRQYILAFPKGSGPQDIAGPNQTGFSNVHLTLQ